MEDIKIYQDTQAVKILAAQARGESIDSNLLKETNDLITELASDLNPMNKYKIAQLVGFTVNELKRPQMNLLANIADVKNVGSGQKAEFKVRIPGVRAFVQAKGATTARSKVATRTITVDTLDVSARPVINIVELRNGMTNMSDLIADATFEMEAAELKLIQKVLYESAKNWTAKYYGAGSGVVKGTLDPMIRHWMRIGGGAPTIIGDIDVISKLSEQTGFTASSDMKQFADQTILEHNAMGYIGKYNGANVISMVNTVETGSDTPVIDTDKLFILPTGVDAGMRPLKVVYEGGVESQEQSNIDDKSYEIRLDQYVGAGIVYGERPYMSVYEDLSL